MPYSHYGNYADVWKHIALCTTLANEKPAQYIETNAASADYALSRSPGQAFGIYHFMDRAPEHKELLDSEYYHIQEKAFGQGRYTGSPGLAMHILKAHGSRYTFFDIEETPLRHIDSYAEKLHIREKVQTMQQDSRTGIMELLPEPGEHSFIHIDPYFVDQPNDKGWDYMDVFVACAQKNAQCFLWYGFHTLSEKDRINHFITQKLKKAGIEGYTIIALILKEIGRDHIRINPGIPGNGLLTVNLSASSTQAMMTYSELLTEIYRDASFEGRPGAIYREVTN
ncbi:MAG: 23S rRNA (adenine(2030)-N(6))-methyltransferase RlmJ [Bacteroidia bacterium]|nr:MAG: 23S rRNA (adenine(2030)-N(6))-methyltransferase RlmJ [Bacteroidia bacterium]